MIRIRTSLIFLLCCIMTELALGQQHARIAGLAPAFAEKTITAFGFHDLLSARKQWLADAHIDAQGKFVLEVPCQEIRYIGLRTDHVTSYLYIEPAANYNVEFPEPEQGVSVTFNDKAETELIFTSLDLSDINSLIIDFNTRYEGFFASNYGLLQRIFAPTNLQTSSDSLSQVARKAAKGNLSSLLSSLEEFSAQMDTMYASFDRPYFKTYRNAVLGDMMLNSRMEPRDFFDRFIAPFPFSAQHKAQCELEKKFFNHYFLNYAQSYGGDELSAALNDAGSYEQLSALIQRDDFVQDPERRDLVISMAIAEVWDNKSMDKSKLALILKTLSAESESKKAVHVADNMLHALASCEIGFPAYSFSLYDQYNERISVSGLAGRPIILEFGASWCSACDSEHHILEAMVEDHKHDFHFIHINMDDLEDLPESTSKHKHIHYLVGISDPAIKENYKVNSLPYYIVIDENGLIYVNEGIKPSEGLEGILEKWEMKKEPSRPKVGGKEN